MYSVKIEIEHIGPGEETDEEYQSRTGFRWDGNKRGGDKRRYDGTPTIMGKGTVTAETLRKALDKAEAFLGIHEEEE